MRVLGLRIPASICLLSLVRALPARSCQAHEVLDSRFSAIAGADIGSIERPVHSSFLP